jgi:hypothetical protein
MSFFNVIYNNVILINEYVFSLGKEQSRSEKWKSKLPMANYAEHGFSR